MMKEEKILSQTAVLAKLAGFYIEGSNQFSRRSNPVSCVGIYGKKSNEELKEYYYRYDDLILKVPQSSVSKWLREKHNIIVEPKYNSVYNYFEFVIYFIVKNKKIQSEDVFGTHEDAFEAGLSKALNTIIDETK